MGFSRRTISISDDVYLPAKKLIKEEMNIGVSKFIEIQLRSLLRSKSGSVKDVVEGVMLDFIKADKSIIDVDKKILLDSIEGKKGDVVVNGLKGAALIIKKRNKKT